MSSHHRGPIVTGKQAEKAEAEAKENKPPQPTQAEVEEIVRQMNF